MECQSHSFYALPSCGFICHCYQYDSFLFILIDIVQKYKNDIEFRLNTMMRKAIQNDGEESDDDEEELEIMDFMIYTQDQLLVPEGLAIADGFIPESLHAALMQQIDALADGTLEWNCKRFGSSCFVRLCQKCFHQTSVQADAACWHSWNESWSRRSDELESLFHDKGLLGS
jgi:hypothetical protein